MIIFPSYLAVASCCHGNQHPLTAISERPLRRSLLGFHTRAAQTVKPHAGTERGYHTPA